MFVYVIGTKDGPFKIGIAVNPVSRLAELQVGNHQRLEIMSSVEVENTVAAANIERAAHWDLRDYRVGGEWFAVPSDVAEHAILKAVNGGPHERRNVIRPWTVKAFPEDLRKEIVAAAGAQKQTVAHWVARAARRQIELERFGGSGGKNFNSHALNGHAAGVELNGEGLVHE